MGLPGQFSVTINRREAVSAKNRSLAAIKSDLTLVSSPSPQKKWISGTVSHHAVTLLWATNEVKRVVVGLIGGGNVDLPILLR